MNRSRSFHRRIHEIVAATLLCTCGAALANTGGKDATDPPGSSTEAATGMFSRVSDDVSAEASAALPEAGPGSATTRTPTVFAASGALVLPFRDLPLAPRGDEAAIALDRRLRMRLDGPDLHGSSRLRARDETGAHNDFRLEHSGNLLRIPLQR